MTVSALKLNNIFYAVRPHTNYLGHLINKIIGRHKYSWQYKVQFSSVLYGQLLRMWQMCSGCLVVEFKWSLAVRHRMVLNQHCLLRSGSPLCYMLLCRTPSMLYSAVN